MLNTNTRRVTALVLVLALLGALLAVINIAAPWERIHPSQVSGVVGRQL